MRFLGHAWLLFKVGFSGALAYVALTIVEHELDRDEWRWDVVMFAPILLVLAALPWMVKTVRNVRFGAAMLAALGTFGLWLAYLSVTEGYDRNCTGHRCRVLRIVHDYLGDSGVALLLVAGSVFLLWSAVTAWKRSRSESGELLYMEDVTLIDRKRR